MVVLAQTRSFLCFFCFNVQIFCKCFFFVCFCWKFAPLPDKKKILSHFPHIKNISMGLWLRREKTHQIKICTSCVWAAISKIFIYKKGCLSQCEPKEKHSLLQSQYCLGGAVLRLIYSLFTWEIKKNLVTGTVRVFNLKVRSCNTVLEQTF